MYKQKRAVQGGDYYGTWREGRQINAERINGRTLTYGPVKGHHGSVWRGSVTVIDGKVIG